MVRSRVKVSMVLVPLYSVVLRVSSSGKVAATASALRSGRGEVVGTGVGEGVGLGVGLGLGVGEGVGLGVASSCGSSSSVSPVGSPPSCTSTLMPEGVKLSSPSS